MKLRPAENGGESEEQQHTIQQNESADGGIAVLAEYAECNEPDRELSEVQFLSSIVGDGDTESTESGIEDTHEGVVQVFGVCFTRFELE